MTQWKNWSGYVQCQPAKMAYPENEAALRQLLADATQANQTVRVVGSGHSFTPLCATDGVQVSLDRMSGLLDVNKDTRRVRAKAGTRLRALNAKLADYGLALENLGDIDEQSIAGALSTGTHGTGCNLGVLATQITGMRLMQANGELIWLNNEEQPALFNAAKVNLGALGVITEYELACVPAYNLRYQTYKAGWDETLARLEEYRDQHRNFECYWFPYTDTFQIKTMDVTDAPASSRGLWRNMQDIIVENGALWVLCQIAKAFPRTSPAINRIAAAGVPSHDQVAASHEIYATTRAVHFNESEYNIPAEALPAVLTDIKKLIDKEGFGVSFPLEIRYVAADDIPISPAHGRASAYVAAHMYSGMPYHHYFTSLAKIFDAYNGRPHWGKWHDKTASEFKHLYPQWDAFTAIRAEADPDGLFLNDHLRQVFGV